MAEDCIFCKLANGEIPTEMVYENDKVACFKDNNPQAELHLLLVPKKHFKDVLDLYKNSEDYTLALAKALPEVVEQNNLVEKGFRLLSNCGEGAGQSVMHVHFHILSDPDKLQETLI